MDMEERFAVWIWKEVCSMDMEREVCSMDMEKRGLQYGYLKGQNDKPYSTIAIYFPSMIGTKIEKHLMLVYCQRYLPK